MKDKLSYLMRDMWNCSSRRRVWD